ncbi:hypothetical protein LCGC14_1130970 [marine sediment metagenome]|uniref:Uncharacterized protein n=1 Tax=marine sediment metagenome TaxID=412755 RepID=A0A0F9PJC5_9ZZZZ
MMKYLKRLWCRFFGHKKQHDGDWWRCQRCSAVNYRRIGWAMTYEPKLLNPLNKCGLWGDEVRR